MHSNTLPQIINYGQYSSGNYGAHTLCMSVAGFRFWYSYDTIVAFQTPKSGLRMCINCWGPTTGKHLNWISTYVDRLPPDQFEKELDDAVNLLEFGDQVLWDRGDPA
jgi:hypothetical protein